MRRPAASAESGVGWPLVVAGAAARMRSRAMDGAAMAAGVRAGARPAMSRATRASRRAEKRLFFFLPCLGLASREAALPASAPTPHPTPRREAHRRGARRQHDARQAARYLYPRPNASLLPSPAPAAGQANPPRRAAPRGPGRGAAGPDAAGLGRGRGYRYLSNLQQAPCPIIAFPPSMAALPAHLHPPHQPIHPSTQTHPSAASGPPPAPEHARLQHARDAVSRPGTATS